MDWTHITTIILGQVGGEVELGVFSMILRAGLMVKLVLLILMLMSVMAWAVIFYKWRMVNRADAENRRFHQLFLRQQRLSVINEGADDMNFSPVAAIFRAGYIELIRVSKRRSEKPSAFPEDPAAMTTEVFGMANISRAMSKASETELTRLEKALPFLATTGSTAPFIGLFGTVWGIMNAFRGIGLAGSASLISVAPGISEALVATAAGLAAAIPAVVGYNYFIQRIRVLDNEMKTFSAEFLNIVERHFRGLR
jgi:biopolymer transport protein TolQ